MLGVELDTRVQIAGVGSDSNDPRHQKEEQSLTIVTIDGQLSGNSITVVENCCNEAKSNGKLAQLFLRDISTVGQAGQMLLRRLAAKGVRLVAKGVYTSYVVQSLTSALNPEGKPAMRPNGEHQ